VARLTRKELKSDKFALEVQHSVEYVSEHRRQVIRWGGIGVGVLIVAIAIFLYRGREHQARQEALYEAMRIQNAQVGNTNANQFELSFATDTERLKAANKAFIDMAAKYPGSEEGGVAEYFLGANAADDGNLAEAERHFKTAADVSGAYASMAKLALARVYGAQGKLAEGEKLIQSVVDHPTVLVSKDEATIELADLIGKTDLARAKKLLEPLRTSTRPNVSRAAISELGVLSGK
jgi:predicted negative regulator of RcsB-dependent stress response